MGVGSGEWGVGSGKARESSRLIPHSPFPTPHSLVVQLLRVTVNLHALFTAYGEDVVATQFPRHARTIEPLQKSVIGLVPVVFGKEPDDFEPCRFERQARLC